jgi:hypothetical protein
VSYFLEKFKSSVNDSSFEEKAEKYHMIFDEAEKKKNEYIQRWKWIDSLTNTILSTSKLYSITTPRQRHIVWESFYYTKGELSYATVLDELKYKNGETVRKWGKYRFRSEKLVAKEEENNPEVNVENLLKTSKSFTF